MQPKNRQRMIHVQSFVFNAISENTYVLHDETGEAIIIDPGCYDKNEYEELYQYIASENLKPVMIVNTHAHIDHVLGIAEVKRKYGIPFLLHKLDEPVLRAVKTYAPNYGFFQFTEPDIDGYLDVAKPVTFGQSSLEVRFVPGHAPGHIALVSQEDQFVIGGDVLFRQSIGRTDLPGGDLQTLLSSIRTQLFTLPDEYIVYPGHMQETTIGFEKKYNPFFK